jgi:hypothetical protein
LRRIREGLTMQRTILALGLAYALPVLAGCASGPGSDPLASLGPPADAPARPASQAPYPGVHDIPPARGTTPLSPEQQQKLERELSAARARQQNLR